MYWATAGTDAGETEAGHKGAGCGIIYIRRTDHAYGKGTGREAFEESPRT